MDEEGYVLVGKEELHEFIVRCMCACHLTMEHAESLADVLVAADYRGHNSHGVRNLSHYVDGVKCKNIATKGCPTILKETVATALVDGHNLIGPVTANYCMDLAIEKAQKTGMGMVAARGCTHFGIAGWYGQRALKHGMMGIAFTNTSAIMPPTRSIQPILGSNPICLAAPAKDGDRFLLDMATTTVAIGKVAIADDKDQVIPDGWAMDKDGNPVTDPKLMKMMFPLGGSETTSGYKGYGLSMMVDILTGVMAGGNSGSHISFDTDDSPNLGQCFIAINPEVFAEGFTDRLSGLMNSCRSADLAEGETEVLVPGDKETNHMMKCDKQGGISFHPNQIKNANSIAVSLNVQPLATK